MVRSKVYLIDTQIFLWFLNDDKNLSSSIKNILIDPTNQILVSVASIWEILLKKKKGTLKIPKNIEEAISVSGFSLLPIDIHHVLALESLPHIHNDPFDRILIAQAKSIPLTLISSDKKIWKYNLSLVKA